MCLTIGDWIKVKSLTILIGLMEKVHRALSTTTIESVLIYTYIYMKVSENSSVLN